MAANDRSLDEESQLDETLAETFPASDAPANTVETGIHVDMPTDEADEDENDDKNTAGR
jgi:hypothetical protein